MRCRRLLASSSPYIYISQLLGCSYLAMLFRLLLSHWRIFSTRCVLPVDAGSPSSCKLAYVATLYKRITTSMRGCDLLVNSHFQPAFVIVARIQVLCLLALFTSRPVMFFKADHIPFESFNICEVRSVYSLAFSHVLRYCCLNLALTLVPPYFTSYKLGPIPISCIIQINTFIFHLSFIQIAACDCVTYNTVTYQ